MLARLALLLLALSLTLPAHAAEWLRAESEHFIVEARLDERDLRDLLQTMEDFARALDIVLPGETEPGQKLVLALTNDPKRLSRVAGLRVGGVGAGSPEAVTGYTLYDPNERDNRRNRQVFWFVARYHIGFKFFRPQPLWARNGLASFLATAYRDGQSDFIFGMPDNTQASFSEADLQMALTATGVPPNQRAFMQSHIASDALASLLLIDVSRRGVLESYLDAYAAGVPLKEAALKLGDVKELRNKASERVTASLVSLRRVSLSPLSPPTIAVRAMRDDEIALVELRVQRIRDEQREEVAGKLAALTGRFPDSAEVWYEYAAAEYARVRSSDFGEKQVLRGFGFSTRELIVTANRYPDTEAWRAVNRALAIDPGHAQAQRLKAEIMLARLVRQGNPDDPSAYDEVRALLAPLAREPQRYPLAAALYYQTYVEQGATPPDNANEQLRLAFIANADVPDFRYGHAVALVRAGQQDTARKLLISMLNDPDFAEASARALEDAP
jgi:hypothetical protein